MALDPHPIKTYIETILDSLLAYSPKLVSAFFILFVGLSLIRFVNRLIRRIMTRRNVDPTLTSFLGDLLLWALRILLFVTFISKLGVETSSFVAILGAMGLAIGLSLQGSLSNIAGGMLIILFKPFKVGDVIAAQDVVATVVEIQIFVTKLITENNQTVFIPNGSLSNGTIINYSMQGQRRADFTFSVSYDTDLKKAKNIIMTILNKNPKVLKTPAPSVFVLSLNDTAVVLAVRPWATNEDYGDVFTDTLESCKTAFEMNGITIQPYVQGITKTITTSKKE